MLGSPGGHLSTYSTPRSTLCRDIFFNGLVDLLNLFSMNILRRPLHDIIDYILMQG